LLPDDHRAAWRKRLRRQKLELASLVLIAACALLLAIGTWHKYSLITRKEALRAKVQAAQEAVESNDLLTGELVSDYETFRPVFASQQNTVDTLKTLALLQQSRSNRSFWYVLLADQHTYFNPPAVLTTTNRPARTNIVASAAERAAMVFAGANNSGGTPTNAWPAKPGLIAELSVPEDPETARTVLRQLVNALKQQPLFSKVDLLSDDLRQNLADPKVTIPDRDFVLALDFAETDFQPAARLKKPIMPPVSRPAKRRSATRSSETKQDDSSKIQTTIP
jgi:hypothetical protein